MKIVVFGPERRTGAIRDGSIVDLSYAYARYLRDRGERHAITTAAALVPPDLARFIEGGPRVLEYAQQALDYLPQTDQLGPRGEKLVHAAGEVQLHAPKPSGAKIACAGSNFADHAARMAANLGLQPKIAGAESEIAANIRRNGIWGFWKVGRDAVGPDGEVVYPAITKRLDYEGEVAIVIGKDGKDIKAANARDYVWGVTLFCDWSIRDLREADGPYKFAMAKNFDTSHSLGPCIAAGEGIDPGNVDIETFVNGDRRQSYNTRAMIFPFGELMEYLSRDFTLHAGDIISGGTAAGTAADSSKPLPDRTFPPELFLKPGDNVEVRSPAVGSLRTRIVAK